jgi:DNA-binding NtrC family response regulator
LSASDGDITVKTLAVEELPARSVSLRLLFEGERGPVLLPAVPLVGELAIGRQIERGIEVRDPRASRQHAVFRANSNAVTVEDTSSNGTFVNGARITELTALGDGDVVRVGDSLVLVRWADTLPGDAEVPQIDGRHPAMRALRRTIASVAPTDAKVLIVGETGTGKELVARAIHERSERSGPFIAVNCGAIPESLAESQLFGHAAGSFTGAQGAHAGFMRAAHGGTLFLDEIGELTPVLQPKLLRALEERKVVPVGRTEPVDVDVRLITATNRDLLRDVDANAFRGDLYARVAGYVVHTTPLRERREDVLPLLSTFLGANSARPSADLAEALLLHPFRFNVRELKEMATQLKIDGAGLTELPLSLIARRLSRASTPPPRPSSPELAAIRAPKPPPPTREQVDALLREHSANVSRVARVLGRSRRQIYRYMEEWGLSLDDYKT